VQFGDTRESEDVALHAVVAATGIEEEVAVDTAGVAESWRT
jgi:hypothetical protein